MLDRSLAALKRGELEKACDWALKALEVDERAGIAWHLLAVAREQSGDFVGALTCYEAAFQLLPDDQDIVSNLGRLACRLGQNDVAEKLYRIHLSHFPDNPETNNNLAHTLHNQGKSDEATEILKLALAKTPEHPALWNTLGAILAERGESVTAEIFFNEAIRLDPKFSKARYNRSNMRLVIGQVDAALEDCETALGQTTAADERAMMRLSRSALLLNLGRIGEGWDEYEARLDPNIIDGAQFRAGCPVWTPGQDLQGKSLLVFGEQGLGDEVLFANLLPDLLERLGPKGHLTLGVEPRLIPLFQRSFPQARIEAHATYSVEGKSLRIIPALEDKFDEFDFWAPLGSPLREFRRTVDAYPNRKSFLTPDPERVAHWQAELARAPAGRKVGILWKSALMTRGRNRYFSPFELWAPVLTAPGITIVNMQYGDCGPELAYARDVLGVELWTPPGIDLMQDLDDVAALTCALDVNLGFSNATLNLAAACGAPAWLISTLGAWPRLGTSSYPWYPQMRVFQQPGHGSWEEVMAEIAEALEKSQA